LLDTAFDAWYVLDYFNDAGGFAAVPLGERGLKDPQFSPAGLPHCQAGLPMPLKSTFTNNRGLLPQKVGNSVCPLLYPEATASACPIDHEKWTTGGCLLKMGTSPGARLRYQIFMLTELFGQARTSVPAS